MSETTIRSFRREKISNLSKSLIGNYIGTKVEGGKLGFKTLKYIDDEGDEDSIKIKDIFSKDFIRIQNLFSVLDDLVAYDYSRFGISGQLNGFWNRFKEENFYLPENEDADSASPTDMIKLNLSQCDQAIRLIYWVLGADNYIREKEEQSEKKGEKKYTFGSLLFDSHIDQFIDNGLGRYDDKNPSVKTVISVLLAERNKWAVHQKTADDSKSMQRQNIAALLEECRNKTAIVLVALLHIVDYHYDALDSFFVDFFSKEENRKLTEESAANEVIAYDPEAVKRDYVQSLLASSIDELKKNVGNVGNIANADNLKLMNLKMQLVWKDQAPIADDANSKEDSDFAEEVTYLDLRHVSDAENRVNIILGNPGSGKSTLLSQLQKQLASSWIEGEMDAQYPVSIPLKGVGKDNFIDAIRDSIGERAFSVVEPMCKSGNVVFILDGLNELTLKNPINFYESLCKTIRSEYAGCRFFITGRIHEFNEFANRFQSLNECSIYQMRDISRDDIITYFRELRASEASKNTFWEWIQNAQLSDLLASPLNFSMIAKMVLNQDDYTVPVESINNRGELLDIFLKSTLQDRGVLTTGIEGDTFRILQLLANALDDNNNHPVSRTSISSYCKELYPDATAFERDLLLREALVEPCNLNVLSKTTDVNGEELYSFTIDTFQEYFNARSFAIRFVGNATQGLSGEKLSNCLSDDFNVRDARRFEVLKLALELIAGGRIQKETATADGVRFIDDFLSIYSDSLSILADLSSTLPLLTPARTRVEKEVLEEMISYRENNVMPLPEEHKAELLSITKSAVKLSTDALYQELFNYYWMSATGMVAYWEFGFSFSFSSSTISQFRNNLVSNCTNPSKFYDFLHRAALDIIQLYSASNSFLNLTRNLLFAELTTYRQKILYQHIRESYNESVLSGLYSRPDHLLSQDASLLLMYMDDPEYIYQNLDLKEMKRTGAKIGTHTLMKLLQNYLHPAIPRIIFQNAFFDLLKVDGKTKEERERQKKYKTASIIRYYLFRNCRPQELLDYLSPTKGNGIESLLEHERFPILDLLPISELRAYKQLYYDSDVFQYLDEFDDDEESVEGLHYRIYKRDERQTHVWIRNITTPLGGLIAEVGSHKAKIVNDGLLISRQYRFKLSSTAIIDASGRMTVSGKTVYYDAPFAGPEVIISTFDDGLAKLLSEAESVQIGDAQICTIQKSFESRPKAWRVLTLNNAADIPYFGDMRFTQDGSAVNIDKTIRADGYKFDPQLFRRLENLPTQNCIDTPFVLLGHSNTRIWVVTDKLMNYDRYKNAGAIVRAKGSNTLCRFLEAHPFSEGFVELTFRSAAPFDFPEDGLLYYTADNQEEDSVPYVFCHSMGTRAFVRILDKDFVESISVLETRLSYMAGGFHIGKMSLSLDYVEIFPASERLSIWTLQRLSGKSFLHTGLLEVSEDTSFEKLFHLSFSKETRIDGQQLLKDSCVFYNAEESLAHFVIASKDEAIATGLYLTNDEHATHLCISESHVCDWIAKATFTPEILIPREGTLSLPGCDQVVHFSMISKDGSKNSIIAYSLKNELEYHVFEEAWQSARTIGFTSNEGKTVNTGFRGTKELSIIRGTQLLRVGVPAGCDPSQFNPNDWYLSVFCPIRNEVERGYDAVEKTVKVHSVPYNKFSERAIIIRKPATEFKHLFIKIDNNSEFASIKEVSLNKNDAYDNNPFGIEYCIVEMKNEKNKRLNIEPNGEIGFFTRQSNEYIPVSVGYRRVLEVIDFKKARKLRTTNTSSAPDSISEENYYPAQICEHLFKELSDIDVINEELVKFFADHSRAYMLFTESNISSKVQSLECEKPIFNLCTVRSVEKDGRVNTYSWLNDAPFPSMDIVDDSIHPGDLVLVERNHKISPINPGIIKGSVFPNVGELPSLTEEQLIFDVSSLTWQQEETRVKKFKNDVATLISFFSQKDSNMPLEVSLPDMKIESDVRGIIVECALLPDISFRLCGVSESSYEALLRGESISVLPSQKAIESFNPYRFTLRGIVFVIDAAKQTPIRNANYYCVVNDAAIKHARKDNVVGVVYGDVLGSFINSEGVNYNNGNIVHLQLSSISETAKGVWYRFSTDLNEGARVGELNLNVGDILDDIIVINNGSNNSFIEVEYRVQESVIRGYVDNNMPFFSSRMLCGLYRPGVALTLRVKALMDDANSIRFELVDEKVKYPFGSGVYNCKVHTENKTDFDWRLKKGLVAAWATFQVDDEKYTIEIPQDEMLSICVGKDQKNLYYNYMTCGQYIPAQIEISGFLESGDPIISLRTHNEGLLNDLSENSAIKAKIMYVNTQEHVALWVANNMSGLAEFRIRPQVGSDVNIRPKDANGRRKFIVDNEDITHELLPPNYELYARFYWDERYLDSSLFVAEELNSDSSLPTGRLLLCRHTRNTLAQYWIEYLICQGLPLKAYIDYIDGDIHYVTFNPRTVNNLDGFRWEKDKEYDVTVETCARNYVIVKYIHDDGRTIIGAIDFGRIDPFFKWAPDYEMFKTGDHMTVKFSWCGMANNAVLFSPMMRDNRTFPYGLNNGDVVNGYVYHVDNQGNAYVKLRENDIRVKIPPYFADWSVLPSGKSIVKEGEERPYVVTLKKTYLQLSLSNDIIKNPWKENILSCQQVYPVVIKGVDSEMVLVGLNGLFGEIPTAEFQEPISVLEQRIGDTVFARPSIIDLSSHTILFTTVGISVPDNESMTPEFRINDIIIATVKDYIDDTTPLLEFGDQQFLVSPSIAAVLSKRPWLEKVDVKESLPIDSEQKLIISEIDDEGRIVGVKPYNHGTSSFIQGEETEAVVLQCSEEGVYAETIDGPEDKCLVFIPKDELMWGRVYTASNFYRIGQHITVIRCNKNFNAIPHLITCSIKQLQEKPGLQLKDDLDVQVVIENILPTALNVLCNGVLQTQISVDDTTWNPSYLLGKQAKLTKRFNVGESLSALVEEGGVDQAIRLSLRDKVNPWDFGQIVVGDEWPAFIIKILDDTNFVVTCRGLFVWVTNTTNLDVEIHTKVKIRIQEVFPDKPYASAILLSILPEDDNQITRVDAEQIPFRVGQQIPAKITRIHHHLMDGDTEDYLEFEPISYKLMTGEVHNNELAWRIEDRLVDSYRVGDEIDVVITGMDFLSMKMIASIREADQSNKDPRSLDDIAICNTVEARNNYAGRIKEEITVIIKKIEQQFFDDTKTRLHYIDFSYGNYPGRVSIDDSSWSAIQDPEHYFLPGSKIGVQIIGKVDYYDRAIRSQRTILKAIIPSIKTKEEDWDSILNKEEAIEGAQILSVRKNELFVRYAGHFIVKMNRDQLVWEPTLPLKDRFKIDQIIPVLVKSIEHEKQIIELDSRSLYPDPYREDLSLQQSELYNGKIIAEEKDKYYLEIDTSNDSRIVSILPFSEFPYPWHRNYKKGDIVKVSIKAIELDKREILATRKDERLSELENNFIVDRYYWFKVLEYQKNGLILDYDGYRLYMDWEDAWLDNVSDPSDMYPVGLKCLLRVKAIEGSRISLTAQYDWKPGVDGIRQGRIFKAEVCLRNPANGIVMRVADTDDQFCFITRRNFSEPLMSDILSYIPRNCYKLTALYTKKKGQDSEEQKVYAKFNSGVVASATIEESDFAEVRPGKVVSGIAKRVTEDYVIVLYKNIQIYVDKNYIDRDIQRGDPITIRITHHEYYKDNQGIYVSKKLLGSESAVLNDPFMELPIGRQVSGLVVIASTKKGQVVDLRVDLSRKGTVIGKLQIPWGKSTVYRGQRVIAYVSSHNYVTREVVFTLYRPDMNRLAIGSTVKASVLEVNNDASNITVDVSFKGAHHTLSISPDSLYWGKNPSTSFIKVGSRFTMAVVALNKQTPTVLTRKHLYIDYCDLTGEIVHGRVMAHTSDGCVIMAGATVGLLPLREMSYQRCELWEQVFPIGNSFDLMICPYDDSHPETTIFSYRRVYDNPFDSFNPEKLLRKKTFIGRIARATEDNAVAKLENGIEALITNMKVFSDGFQTIIPQIGTNVHLRIAKVEMGNDGLWSIEVMVIPNSNRREGK